MPHFSLPHLGLGVGLRAPHYRQVLEQKPKLGWFEIISENFLYTEGRPLDYLDAIAQSYPLVMHGVSLSIGSTDALDLDYLARLKALKTRVQACWVSDHLAWTGIHGKNSHDLLPLPYTEEALQHVVERVKHVQDYLGVAIALENPSSYLSYEHSPIPEWEFLGELAKRADCALLIDVNNVYVSAFNHGFDALNYLKDLPYERVVQFHVAGHTHCGSHILDTHIGPVPNEVWGLLRYATARAPHAAILLEWDAEIPPLSALVAEAALAYTAFDHEPPRLAPAAHVA